MNKIMAKSIELFSLHKIRTGIYHLQFELGEELSAYFMRFQEFYESPAFRGKIFQIIDFIRWYSSTMEDKKFSYLTDWGGFNLPVNKILELYPQIPDRNEYDDFMFCIAKKIIKDADGPAYLVGTSKEYKKALDHEIAHGLFYIDEEYQKHMTLLVKELSLDLKQRLESVLKRMGYVEDVFVDEIQAFLATGTNRWMRVSKDIKRPFEEFYEIRKKL